MIVNASDGFSPLYVAAAYGHQNICQQILTFLKEFPDFNDRLRNGMANKNGFLSRLLMDAVTFNQTKMIQTIFNSINNALSTRILYNLVFLSWKMIDYLEYVESDILIKKCLMWLEDS